MGQSLEMGSPLPLVCKLVPHSLQHLTRSIASSTILHPSYPHPYLWLLIPQAGDRDPLRLWSP